ncbi:hypothetical protein TVAG_189620 [Trichomonas vaginalis G3]|uniref:Uncharacterized protein n=1 Tax=Trichomonas vaginalis (strain ATCC PRA-98 / G3) TaxID=412133 RepID=A2F1R6_TRIV3|nr:hypothetical protein TVAGG3_0149890 [Trichomonas vaginalis G3]EAY01176.1 hypothetical protein TVAG_189620 [Trichomonas vaginalis G3]KAI5547203.1 hypothetical protein TVAGG3_0149890 [Trichomonas vaginalis G3]|eukprot:XP_001330123.1 hypothetical protein [Trichomonas vaginalis G3]
MPIHIIPHPQPDRIFAEITDSSFKFNSLNPPTFNVYCNPSVPHFKVYYKVGSYSSNLQHYTYINEYDGPLRNFIYFPTGRLNISRYLTKIQDKVTFIMTDATTSEILNYTEFTNVRIVPDLRSESVILTNKEKVYMRYFFQNQEVITGRVTFENEVDADELKFSYNGAIQAFKPYGNSKKIIEFSIQLTVDGSTNYIELIFRQCGEFSREEIQYIYVDINYNKKYLPLSSTGGIKGTLQITHNAIYGYDFKTVAKLGGSSMFAEDYNVELIADTPHSYSVQLNNQIKYVSENYKDISQVTFAAIMQNKIVVSKTFDITIVAAGLFINSISDISSTHTYKAGSRMLLKIESIEPKCMQDTYFKYKFEDDVTKETPLDINNSPILKIERLTQDAENENEFILSFIIPSTVTVGQKKLLLQATNPIESTSAVIPIDLTIEEGSEITQSSIDCRATEDSYGSGHNLLFKCNINNIESSEVTYKAKLGNHDSAAGSSQYDLNVRMEAVGTTNEFNVYVYISTQTVEQTTISFAMIKTDSSASIINYCEISNLKICAVPDIELDYPRYFSETGSIAPFDFKLKYIGDFNTMKVQFKNEGDEAFEDAFSVSSLDENNFFSVKVRVPRTRIYFKFIDKFNNSVGVQCFIDTNRFSDASDELTIQDLKDEYHEGDEVTIKWSPSISRLAYRARDFYFVDYTGNSQNNILLASTTGETVEFNLTLPNPKSSYPCTQITIFISSKADPIRSYVTYLGIKIIPTFKFDFEIVELDLTTIDPR